MSSSKRCVFAKRVMAAGLALTLSLSGLSACATSEGQQQVEASTTLAATTDDTQDLASELLSDRDLDASYDAANATTVTLSDAGTQADGDGIAVEGSTVTITQGGTYVVSGSLSEGQLVIDAGDDEKVQLVLARACVQTSGPTALYVRSAKKVFLTLDEGSTNTLAATGEDSEEDGHNLDGAIWSHEKLTINGSGALAVTSAQGHGIVAKDDLALVSGSVSATAAVDAVQAKGMCVVYDGSYDLSAGDDGIHSDSDLYVLGGSIDISQSYEGLEGATVTVAGGDVSITSSDDGINASGVSDDDEATSSETAGAEQPGQHSAGMDDYDETAQIRISGGKIEIDAEGDGIDSNGDLTISGGETYVSGPTGDGDGALDYAGTGTITGGILVAAGSTGMAQNMGEASTQPSMLVTLAGQANSTITVTDESGSQIASYSPTKSFSCVVISTPALEVGASYTVSAGSSSTTVSLDTETYSDVSGGMSGSGQPQAPGAGNAMPGGQGQMSGGQEVQPGGAPGRQG